MRLRFAQRTGLLVAFRTAVTQAPYCRDCARHVGRRMQNWTLLAGWWSIVSLFLNVATVAGNARSLLAAGRLPTPSGDASDGLDPGRPVFQRAGAPLVACVALFGAVQIINDDSAPIEVGGCVRLDGDAVDGVECGASHDGIIVSRVDVGSSCDPRNEWWVEQIDQRGGMEVFCVENDQHPPAWHADAADLVAGVESAFGAPFEHPVDVVTMEPDAFVAAQIVAPVDDVELDAADDALLPDDQLRWWRTLGLVSGELTFDLSSAEAELTAAWFDPVDETIYVRGDLSETERRQSLAHEMTHALQHQTTGLSYVELDGNAARARQMVIEGDARRVERTVVPWSDDASGEADRELPDEIPVAVMLEAAAPYVMGDAATSLRAVLPGGMAAWYEEPPGHTSHLLSAIAMAAPLDPTSMGRPQKRGDDDVLAEGELDSLLLWELLAGQVDDDDALAALDGWRNGRWTAVETDDDQLCVIVEISSYPIGTLTNAIDAWADTLPEATFGYSPDAVKFPVGVVRACDPGPDGPTVDDQRRIDAFALPAVELHAIASLVEPDVELSVEVAGCLSAAVRSTLSTAERRGFDEPSEQHLEELEAKAAACTDAPGTGGDGDGEATR